MLLEAAPHPGTVIDMPQFLHPRSCRHRCQLPGRYISALTFPRIAGERPDRQGDPGGRVVAQPMSPGPASPHTLASSPVRMGHDRA